MAVQRKSPKALKVKSPRPDQFARLNYNQPICLCLPAPTSCGFTNDHKWHIKVDSEFLVHMETTEGHKPGEVNVCIMQNDLVQERWTNMSNVFLGHIKVYLKTDDASIVASDHISTVHVFLDCHNPERQDHVTVMLPVKSRRGSIRIPLEPSQVLEVVVADDPFNRLQWNGYTFATQRTALAMESKHHEAIPRGEGFGLFGGDPSHTFYTERMIFPNGDGTSPLFDEHHFFYTFIDNPEQYLELTDGIHPACRLAFIGKGKQIMDHRIDISMRVRGCVRRREELYKSAKREQPLKVDPLQRVLDERHRKLFNPTVADSIYLKGNFDDFVIEVVQPSVYCCLQNGEEANWSAFVQSLPFQEGWLRHINVTQLASVWLNDARVQRFRVNLIDGAKILGSTDTMLGKLVIECKEVEKWTGDNRLVVHLVHQQKDTSVATPGLREFEYMNQSYRIRSNTDNQGRLSSVSAYGKESKITPVYDTCSATLTKSQRKRLKKKHKTELANSSSDALYYDVKIEDEESDNEILHLGEVYELMETVSYSGQSSGCGGTLIPYKPGGGQPLYRVPHDYEDYDVQEADDAKKKRNPKNTYESNGPKSSSGLNENHDPINLEALPEQNDEKINLYVPDAKQPFVLNWPVAKSNVKLMRGQPLIINVLLPFKKPNEVDSPRLWAVNAVNSKAKDGYHLWINRSEMKLTEQYVPFLQVEVFPLTPPAAEVGYHQIGSIRFHCGANVKTVDVELQIGPNDHRESARWWLEYHRCLRVARPLRMPEPMVIEQSTIQNRTTILNPTGPEPIEVQVLDTHEIEIILHDPVGCDAKNGGWSLNVSTIGGGEIDILDSAIYPIWEGDRGVFRALLHCKRKADQFFGDIKIVWDGVETNARINAYAGDPNQTAQLTPRVRQPANLVAGTSIHELRLPEWQNNDTVTIFPTESLTVFVPDPSTFLDRHYQRLNASSRWDIGFVETSLSDEVMDILPDSIVEDIDQCVPFYGHSHLFCPTDRPWAMSKFFMPSLDTIQPFVHEIIEAMRKVKAQTSYPLASITFSKEVQQQFVITQTLHVRLGDDKMCQRAKRDLESYKPKEGELVVRNPADTSKITINHGHLLHIQLPFKWKSTSFMSDMDRTPWVLKQSLPWLGVWHYVNHEKSLDVFEIIPDKPFSEQQKMEGELVFQAGAYKKRIKLAVVPK